MCCHEQQLVLFFFFPKTSAHPNKHVVSNVVDSLFQVLLCDFINVLKIISISKILLGCTLVYEIQTKPTTNVTNENSNINIFLNF